MAALSIAVTQPPMSADIAANGRVVRAAMQRAAAAGARLVQFPEGMLSGYAKEQFGSWADVDLPLLARELDRTVRLAGELGIWTVLGSAHPSGSPTDDAWPYNSLYVISAAGAVVARYDKRVCSHTEATTFYTAGRDAVVFDVDGVRFGCALCIEVNFPELFAAYAEAGVDVVLLSAYPVDSVFAVKARALAATYNVWIAVAAPAQTRELFPSAAYAPNGDLLCDTSARDVAVAPIDPADPRLRVALDLARPWRAGIRQRLSGADVPTGPSCPPA